MLDCPPESKALADLLAQSDAASPSAIEDKTVSLFHEIRLPLLRYLSAFPLARPDAEDVVQEAFLALFQQLQRGKSQRNVRGWLFQVAHRLAIKKRLRSRKDIENTGSLAAVAENLVSDPAPNPEDQLAFNQRQRRLMSVVCALPEQHRCCLYLRAEGLGYREIAEVLDMSLGAVSIALARSLARIARAIQP